MTRRSEPFARALSIGIVIVSAYVLLCVATARAERTGPFIIGADISWIPEDEVAGAKYFDQGVQKDIFAILKEHGFNYVRLRVFVDPKSDKGYARRTPEAFCDLEHTKAMAKRAKAAGMGILISFHYSDSWADPEHQPKPAAWEKLAFSDLVIALHDHTKAVVSGLKEQGTTPDMVQIGNEITYGILWPDGQVGDSIDRIKDPDNFDNLATLIKAGITATKQVDPAIRIMLHHHLGRHNKKMIYWMDNLLARDVQFDIIGMSCYAQAKEGDWKTNIDDLAVRYPKHDLICAEYSARKRYVNDLIFNAPNRKGLGTFIWEPTRHRESLFDKDGRLAGGGQASNFVATEGIDQGATSRPASRPATSPPATRPSTRRTHGGRYDTNAFIDLYPQMARDYSLDGQ